MEVGRSWGLPTPVGSAASRPWGPLPQLHKAGLLHTTTSEGDLPEYFLMYFVENLQMFPLGLTPRSNGAQGACLQAQAFPLFHMHACVF